MSKKKKFDCVEMKHDIQAKIYEETKNMTWEQESAYRLKAIETGPLAKWWQEVKSQQSAKTSSTPRGRQKKTKKAA